MNCPNVLCSLFALFAASETLRKGMYIVEVTMGQGGGGRKKNSWYRRTAFFSGGTPGGGGGYGKKIRAKIFTGPQNLKFP